MVPVKSTGTTKKHAGGGKHHGGGKHNPKHISAHDAKLRAKDRRIARAKAIQHAMKHPHVAGKPGRAKGLPLGEAVPCCSAEALAASLRLAGWPVSDADTYRLHVLAGGAENSPVAIQAALEAATRAGLAGIRLLRYWAASPASLEVVLGLTEPDHAVLATPEGWWSWGFLLGHGFMPYTEIDEAWELRWAL